VQVISLEEFRDGCAKLNSLLPGDCQLTNIDRTLQMMDFDGSGSIDINEFFEVGYRSSVVVVTRFWLIIIALCFSDISHIRCKRW